MLPILWTTCKCSVWPIVATVGYGPCGRCHERPVPNEGPNTEEQALKEFVAREGHLPEPHVDRGGVNYDYSTWSTEPVL